MFGNNDGQMNHYLDETTYGKFQFTPASETSGCNDEGVVTVTMSGNHPNTQTKTIRGLVATSAWSRRVSAGTSNDNLGSILCLRSPGTWHQVAGAKHLVLGTKYLVPSIK